MRICVYCSSSDGLDSKYYEEGRAFGRELAKRGHSLVYGGYCKGIMAAVAEGVHENGGEITAVVPKVFDREGFTYEGCTRVIKTPDMNSRKKTMEAEADAIAVLPGGIGTMDEFFEALVLKTIGEFDKPVGVLNTAGCYDILVQLLDRSTEDGFLSTSNRECARFFTDADVMLDHLEKESGLYDYPFIPPKYSYWAASHQLNQEKQDFSTVIRRTVSGKCLPVCLKTRCLWISSRRRNFFTGTILHYGTL